MQGPIGMGVNRDPQGVSEVQLQPNKIQQARSLREIDKDIEIAVSPGLASSARAKDPGPGHPVPT